MHVNTDGNDKVTLSVLLNFDKTGNRGLKSAKLLGLVFFFQDLIFSDK